MIKLCYYLETSVLNRLFDESDPARRDATIRTMEMIEKMENVELCISLVLMDEVQRAPEKRRTEILNWIRIHPLSMLEINEDAQTLADRYIHEGLIPEKSRNDALHIALSSIHGVDALLSWNMEHIVKLKTRRGVNGINKLLGYKEIELVTPEEVV